MSSRFKNVKKILVILLLCQLILVPFSAHAMDSNTNDRVINIIAYEITDLKDTFKINELKPGDEVLISITLYDSSVRKEQIEKAAATLNTRSFRALKQPQQTSDSEIKKIISDHLYTLLFQVKYTGYAQDFCFDLSYDIPDEKLPMQKIELKLNQCIPLENTKESLNQKDSEASDDFEEPVVKAPSSDANSNAPADTPNQQGSYQNADKAAEIETKLILESFSCGGRIPRPGEDFDLELKTTASSGSYPVNNVRVTVEIPETLNVVKDTNQYYIGTISPSRSENAVFHLHIAEGAAAKSCEIKVILEGLGAQSGIEVHTEETISVPIKQIERLEIIDIKLPEKVNASFDDGSGLMEVILANKGKASISNLHFSLEGQNVRLKDDADANNDIFTLNSGEQKSYALNIKAEKEGAFPAELMIYYKNSDGEEKTISKSITINAFYQKTEVDTHVHIDKDMIKEHEPVPFWAWLIGIAGISAGLYALIKIILKKRRISEARKNIGLH